MIDLLAAISLAGAASRMENAGQLLSDAETLYGVYEKAKAGPFDIKAFAASPSFKPTVEAAARVTAALKVLVNDPAQQKNIANLLSSI